MIDYGHTTPAAGDTLQAVRGHGYELPLTSPGEADLTVHVNFYDLASTLHRAGLALDGPVMQAEFLGSLGIVERASRLMAANPTAGRRNRKRRRAATGAERHGRRASRCSRAARRSLPPLPGFGSRACNQRSAETVMRHGMRPTS